MPSAKSPDEARANDIAQKSESMARELSHKREQRRLERERQQSAEDPAAGRGRASPPRASSRTPPGAGAPPRGDDRAAPARPEERDTRVLPESSSSPPFYPERKRAVLDDVATELEELLRDVGLGWRRAGIADRITIGAALCTLVGALLPWVRDDHRGDVLGIAAGGALHVALAVTAIALSAHRGNDVEARGERLSRRVREARARRTNMWLLLLGAASTLLCAYLLVTYGLQRSAVPGLQVRFGLYVTLAAGMGLSYGGFTRFFSRTPE